MSWPNRYLDLNTALDATVNRSRSDTSALQNSIADAVHVRCEDLKLSDSEKGSLGATETGEGRSHESLGQNQNACRYVSRRA